MLSRSFTSLNNQISQTRYSTSPHPQEQPETMMKALTKHTLTNSRSYTYTYYALPPAKPSHPTLLLCHGCPDTAHLWSDLITNHLQPAGYGAIAADELGYGGTSKPVDSAAYGIDLLVADLVEILDAERIAKVVVLGHDWGSVLAQRLYNFHPGRVSGLVTLGTAYAPPSGMPFDLPGMLEMMTRLVGYGPYWYFYLFKEAEGRRIVDAHVESFFTALHGDPASWMELLCKKDGLKEYLLADKKQDVQEYATKEMRAEFVSRFSRDGFEGPLLWYQALLEGRHVEAEKRVLGQTSVVKVPYLFIAALRDPLALPAAVQQPKEMGLLPDLTVEEVDAPHWCMLSKPKEVGEALVKWLKAKY